eukprot:9873358-Prorocentrum_lima.AAC.1
MGAKGGGTRGKKGNPTTASADCEDYDQENPHSWYQLEWEEPEEPGEPKEYTRTHTHNMATAMSAK